jgi:hypothetical protein
MEKTIVIDGITICIEATPTENLVQDLEPAKRAFFEERIAALKEFMKSVPSGPSKHNLIRR